MIAVIIDKLDKRAAEVCIAGVPIPSSKIPRGLISYAEKVLQVVDVSAILKEPVVILQIIGVHPIVLAADLILLECTKVRQILEFAGNIVGRDVHNIHQQLSWQLTTDEGRIPHAES